MTTLSSPLSDVPTTSPGAWGRRVLTDTVGQVVGRTARYQAEGPRGSAVRASIYVRHVLYLLVVLAASGLTQGLLGSLPQVNDGGMWMLLACTLILATAAVGTMFYADHRSDILAQARHFLFGIVLFPGTGVAVLLWATRGLAASMATSNTLTSTLQYALPLIFFATVIIPPLLFVKVIAGLRNLHRSRYDDVQAISLWTRTEDGVR